MTEEQPNVLCESVQMCIAVGDPLTAEQTAHLNACAECRAFEHDMAALDEALPKLSAGTLTNQKGQTVAETVEKELALQKRFSSGKSLPRAFRHVGFAAAAVVVLVGGLVVMKTRQAMKPAGSAYVADKPMMLEGTAFSAAVDDDETVFEAAECEPEYECDESAELPAEEEAESEEDKVMFYAVLNDEEQTENKEPENKKTAVNGAARAAEKQESAEQPSSEQPKPADTAAALEDNAPMIKESTEMPMTYQYRAEEPPQPTEEEAVTTETVEEAAVENEIAEEEIAEVPAEKTKSDGAGGGMSNAYTNGIRMKALPNASSDTETKSADEAKAAENVVDNCKDADEYADEADALPLLTMQTLEALAVKGDALMWEDFAPFDGYDVGSGLYIMRYDIDERFYVLVGGGSMQGKPMYIRLCDAQNADRSIDVRTDDIEAFVKTE